jgi:hypothetical protein
LRLSDQTKQERRKPLAPKFNIERFIMKTHTVVSEEQPGRGQDLQGKLRAGSLGAARGTLALLLACTLLLHGFEELHAQQAPPRAGYHQLTFEQLDQLVAPVALYPDALVAQILAAATFEPQVAEANLFVAHHPGIPPTELARMADQQPWDPSVKALVAFPSVLSQMNRNRDWTIRLGAAYYNQPGDVMSAVQVMRGRAYAAGTLRSTPQETVVYAPADIVIRPVSPAVVYVPAYNPWIVYGAPVVAYPAYAYVAPPPPAGGMVAASLISFSLGVAVGEFAHYGWGWGHWGCAWGPHPVVAYNHTTYVSRSVTVVNHGYYGGYDHSVTAYGARGGVYTDQHSVANGQYTNTRTATGPHGATYTDQRSGGDGQYANDRTVTRPNGATATDQRTVANGQATNTWSATGANGRTASGTTTAYAGGSSSTVTGPNGNTVDRSVTGRGTGDATVTRTGPNGTKTHTRCWRR